MNGVELAPDEITDADYQAAVDAQDATLFAAGRERRTLGKLRVRIERGAVDRGTRYYFDLERGIVRRRDSTVAKKEPGRVRRIARVKKEEMGS